MRETKRCMRGFGAELIGGKWIQELTRYTRCMVGRETDAAFEEFFSSYKDRVFRVVLVAVCDRQLAEDAASEAFTRALRDWSKLRDHPSPVAWVVRTALNHARSDRRRTLRLVSTSVPDLGAEDDPPTDPQLVKCVLDLPERQRQVVALRILLDLSTEQTADVLGLAPGTVTAHLFRALSRIKTALSQAPAKES